MAALSVQGTAFVGTEVARAAKLASEDAGPIAASGRRWVAAVGQSLQRAAQRGWAAVVPMAALSVHGTAFVGTEVARAAYLTWEDGGRIAASGSRSVAAVGQALHWAASRGRDGLVAAGDSLQQAASSGFARADRGFLRQHAHQALRLDGSLLFGRHTLVIRTYLSASMVGVSIAMLFVISVLRQPEVPVTPAIVAAPARPIAGSGLRAVALATPVADAPTAAVNATLKAVVRATPERRSAPATAPQPTQHVAAPVLLPPAAVTPLPVQEGSPVVGPILIAETIARAPATAPAQAIEPVADLAPADRERAAITAVLDQYRRFYNALDATSVSTIWRGLDLRALQRAFSALARQNLSFRKCDVNLASSDRARAMCTGVLSFVPRVGSEVEQLRALSWTIDLRQLDDRWQIVDVAAR